MLYFNYIAEKTRLGTARVISVSAALRHPGTFNPKTPPGHFQSKDTRALSIQRHHPGRNFQSKDTTQVLLAWTRMISSMII